MVLLLEADKTFGKKLSDLLDRERVVVVESERQALEMIVKYRDDINAIIANHSQYSVILAHNLITQVCEKLGIKPIPAVGYHRKGDPAPVPQKTPDPGYRLIGCDEADPGFPEKLIGAVRGAYPDLNADLSKARIMWNARSEDLMDLNEWLEEAGFGEMDKIAQSVAPVAPKTKPKPQPQPIPQPKPKPPEPPKKPPEPPEPPKGPPDYKKLYEDLKKEHDALKAKHDELLKQVKDLIDL